MQSKQKKTEITVQHRGGNLTHVHPFYGPNNYLSLKTKVEADNLTMATLPQAASIIYDAYCLDQPNDFDQEIAKEIHGIMKNRWIYTASKSLWIPDQGVKVFPDNGLISLPDHLKNKIGELTPNELEQMLEVLEQSPELVNSADFGYETEILRSSLKLATNAYTKALAGEEGAERLGEVSDKHRIKKPYLGAYDNVKKPLVTVSRLVSFWNFVGRLYVSGYGHGGFGDSHAFGVHASDEVA